MIKYIILTFSILLLSSCGQKTVQQTVEDEGYTYVRSNGSIYFSCSKDDSFLTSEEIVAKNSNGKEVVIKVCCGGPLDFKGCTIRH